MVRQVGYRMATEELTHAPPEPGQLSKSGTGDDWCTHQLPLSNVDYVIVRKLGHIRDPRHKRAFWQRAELTMPDAAMKWVAGRVRPFAVRTVES